jgi:hypothetical protein
MAVMRSMSACAPGHTLKPGWWALRFTGRADRRLLNPACISPQIERQRARAARSAGRRAAPGNRSLRYSAMASVSQTVIPSWVNRGTRNEGDSSNSSARMEGSSFGTTSSRNARPAIRQRSQPRSAQDE